MSSKENPFLLVQNPNVEITKASLTSLIQHKMRSTQTYPAKVSDMVNGVAFVDIMPPKQKKMQDEQNQISSASTMRIHANVRIGDAVLIQAQNGEWSVNTTLTDDVYEDRLSKDIQNRLLEEAKNIANPQNKRASKRILEAWLRMSASESTPWGIPGRMAGGQKLVSKKVLQWCINQTGQHFQDQLREGFPTAKEWGLSEQYFALLIDRIEEQFTAVAITKDEHKSLVESWADILRSHKNRITTTNNTQVEIQSTMMVRQERNLLSVASHKNKIDPIVQELPNHIVELANTFHLPLPKYPVAPQLSTLAAWAESDHLLMKERATDFFLMMLSGGENVRHSSSLNSEGSILASKSIQKACRNRTDQSVVLAD